MATRTQKTKVGIFLIIGFGMIAGAIAIISGATRDPHAIYYLEFEESVLGLGVGGLVEYVGVPVGTVENIYVDEASNAQVVIRVNKDKVTLRKGVTATLAIYSLAAGTMAVHLEGGEPGAPELPEGTVIPASGSLFQSFTRLLQDSVGQLDSVLESVGAAAEELASAMKGMEEGSLAGLVGEFEGLASDSRKFLAMTESTMSELNKTLQRTLNEYTQVGKDVRWLAEDIGEVAETAEALMKEISAKLEPVDLAAVQGDLERAVDQFAQLAEGLNETLAKVDAAADSMTHNVDNMEYALRETLGSAAEALDSITIAVQEIQENPTSLLRGRGKPKEPN